MGPNQSERIPTVNSLHTRASAYPLNVEPKARVRKLRSVLTRSLSSIVSPGVLQESHRCLQ